jgi:HEAT repeat protein
MGRAGKGLALLLLTTAFGCGSKLPYEGKSVEQLQRMLDDPDPQVQAQGAHGLALKGAEAKPAVPALIRVLKSDDVTVREQAARALGEIGPEAREAVPALTAALTSGPWSAQRQAALALGRIGRDARPALPALEKLSNDANRPLRDAVREAIKKIRAASAP